MIVVVKIGTSSITADDGLLDDLAVEQLCAQVAALRVDGHDVLVVSSGAIAAGLPILGLSATQRPTDARTLQAVSAVGQAQLMARYVDGFAPHRIVAGQVLLAPLDFIMREQYLHARSTLVRLLELGVVPVVNENDAVADDEIRLGDNDRIAALVAHLVGADVLVLLTDAAGLFTADPRLDEGASLIEEIIEIDQQLEEAAGGPGSNRGSGGMATKLAAAKIASWSGVRTVIAAADRPDVLADAVAGRSSTGTTVFARAERLAARKVWIAFAVGSSGRVFVDPGARTALEERGASLLAAGVVRVEGDFDPYSAVEIAGPDGRPFAKGLVRVGSADLAARIGAGRSDEHASPVVHRDDLVVFA